MIINHKRILERQLQIFDKQNFFDWTVSKTRMRDSVHSNNTDGIVKPNDSDVSDVWGPGFIIPFYDSRSGHIKSSFKLDVAKTR